MTDEYMTIVTTITRLQGVKEESCYINYLDILLMSNRIGNYSNMTPLISYLFN